MLLLLVGVVISTMMKRTSITRPNFLHYIKKYRRFEVRHHNVAVPCSGALKEGDSASNGQCRLVAKTARFNVLRNQKIRSSDLRASSGQLAPAPTRSSRVVPNGMAQSRMKVTVFIALRHSEFPN